VSDDIGFDLSDPAGEYAPICLGSLATGLLDEFELFAKAGRDFFLIKPRHVRTS